MPDAPVAVTSSLDAYAGFIRHYMPCRDEGNSLRFWDARLVEVQMEPSLGTQSAIVSLTSRYPGTFSPLLNRRCTLLRRVSSILAFDT